MKYSTTFQTLKSVFALFLVPVAILISIVWQGCEKKEPSVLSESKNHTISLNLDKLAAEEPDKFIALIKERISKMTSSYSGTVEDRDGFSDELIENCCPLLEGMIHYEFRADKNAHTEFFPVNLKLSLDNSNISGYITGNSLQNIHDQIHSAIQSILSADSTRVLLWCDCEITNVGTIKTDLNVNLLCANNLIPNYPLCSIQTDDNWHPGQNDGKCDNSNQPKDATDREMSILNSNLCHPECDGGHFVWLTVTGLPFTYNQSSLGNLYWPYITSSGHYCLNSTQMNQTLSILNSIKNQLQPPVQNVKFAGASIKDDLIPIAGGEFADIYWHGYMLFGFHHCMPQQDPPPHN